MALEMAALRRRAEDAERALVAAQQEAEQAARAAHEAVARESALRAAAEARAHAAVSDREAMLRATAWKVTGPVRRLGQAMPPAMRWHLRRGLKAAWWTVTPWHLPRRLAFLRARQREATPGAAQAVAFAGDDAGLAVLPDQALPSGAEPVSAPDRSAPAVPWAPQSADLVTDKWSAARWVVDLLRGRADLRVRFPRALSEGADGAFATWLVAGGAQQLGLPPDAEVYVRLAFATDPSAPARQLYFWRDDARAAHPLGLLPAGLRGLVGWLLDEGCGAEGLQPEEVWWLALCCAESPEAELVRTYRFTPAWQEAHPAGLTQFGRDAFAAWLIDTYGLPRDAAWLDPARWPTGLSVVEELRLAYAARAEWRAAHQDAFATAQTASALLSWLCDAATGLPPTQRAWCAMRLSDGTAEALAVPGANVIAHFCYPCGLRVSAEAMSDAMELAGVPVSRRDLRTERGDDPYHAAFGGLEAHDVTIIHTQPVPYFDDAFDRADLAPRTPRTHRVAYWYWELDSVPESWSAQAAGVDEVWAATRFVADALRRTIGVPVHTLLPGLRTGPFTPRARAAFGIPDAQDRFAFLFAFHMGSIMERKNPLGLIKAFRQAFHRDEQVDLILKTTSFGRFDDQVRALEAAAGDANIHVLNRVLTPDEMSSLIDACDAYVSLHRAEGLGLTMAEAMLLGKPVIATRYSGNLDFMDDENSLLVDCEIVEVGEVEGPYEATARWAEPSVDHAAALMRRLYDDRAFAAELGARGQADARRRLSPEEAGARFAARLAAIKQARRLGGGTLDAECGA